MTRGGTANGTVAGSMTTASRSVPARAPNAGSTLVYFSPQDNDENGTVVMLYNTTAVMQTVVVKAYVASGAFATWNAAVGPNNLPRPLARKCEDSRTGFDER